MKLLLPLLLCSITFCTLHAQQIHFSIRYQPGTVYIQKTQQNIRLNIEPSTSPLAEALTTQNMPDSINSLMETKIQTGKKPGKNETLPFVLTVTKSETNMPEAGIPKGTVVYGTIHKSNNMLFDSIAGDNNDQELSDKILAMTKMISSNIEFPDTTLQVGDSIAVTSNIPVPMPVMELNMGVTTIYKLVKIENNIAHLDIIQSYASGHDTETMPIKLSGSGTGLLLYDILNRFYKQFDMDITTKMDMQMGEQQIGMGQHIKMKQTIFIQR